MLHKELPKYLAPEKLCRNAPSEGAHLVGEIKISDLTNISKDLKSNPNAKVKVDLQFSVDAEGLCAITGKLSVDLAVICQRCLAPMVYPLRTEISVSPVASDAQAEQLPTRYEPLWAPSGEINVAEWIAEEIHLALPLAPCHEPPCVGFDGDEESS